jgi:hypothetical protein
MEHMDTEVEEGVGRGRLGRCGPGTARGDGGTHQPQDEEREGEEEEEGKEGEEGGCASGPWA